jgi:hypothetical protein
LAIFQIASLTRFDQTLTLALLGSASGSTVSIVLRASLSAAVAVLPVAFDVFMLSMAMIWIARGKDEAGKFIQLIGASLAGTLQCGPD